MIKKSFWLLLLLCFAINGFAKESTKKTRGDGKALIGIAHHLIERKEEGASPRWAYRVSFILPNSAAFKGGIKVGDILLSWDGKHLDTISTSSRASALRDYLKMQKRVGDELRISLIRYTSYIGDSTQTLTPATQKQWLSYLRHPKKNLDKNLRIAHKAEKIDKVITLGKRQDDIELPEQKTLFKGLLNGKEDAINLENPLYGLPQELISTFNLSADYADLLERYEEDEKIQSRFIHKRFQYLHRSPFDLLPVTQHQTDQIITQSEKGHRALLKLLSKQLDISLPQSAFKKLTFPISDKLDEHTDFINQILEKTHQAHKKAFAKLQDEEIAKLKQELPQLMGRFANSFYIHQGDDKDNTAADKQNRELLEFLQKVDLSAFFTATSYLLQLTDKKWLSQLNKHSKKWLSEKHNTKNTRTLNSIITQYESTYGRVIIGSEENNIYTQPAAVIIDLGGNDKYYGANSPQKTPINLLVDQAGDDFYSSALPYAQAATLLGVSLLFDYQGNDRYVGSYYAQAVAIGGVALLYDEQGDDHYWGQRFAQGVGFWGVGLLHDGNGDDRYHAWRYAQGVGGVGGIGLLLEKQGDDRYHALGEGRSSYNTIGNFQSSSQGFGVGFRGYAPGGTGVLIDQQGKDIYEAGNFAQGTGYFFALGILRDLGEQDDTYAASRYGIGASAHSAAGVFIEDGGNDHYSGNHIALLGSAWDLALAAFWDKKGNDSYRQTARGFSIGVAAHNGHSVFLDSAGKDNYHIKTKQVQAPRNDYHGGSSFAFFIDAGGDEDNYHQEKFNNNSLLYEYNHAFMLDLPSPIDAQTKKRFWKELQ